VLALIITYSFINWTTFAIHAEATVQTEFTQPDIEMAMPRSTEEPPPPPPPPPVPTIQEVPDHALMEEEVTFLDQSVEAASAVEIPKVENASTPPPPPPPMPEREEHVKEIFMVVEDMPRFPGCENQPTKELKETCSEQQMISFIYNHIKFPAIAVENGIFGNVIIQFVVNTDGSIVDINVLRDIGGGCGEEAIRVVELMNSMPEKWIPGKQRGRPVRVLFTLPVRFKLQLN
jgi:protein TonB